MTFPTRKIGDRLRRIGEKTTGAVSLPTFITPDEVAGLVAWWDFSDADNLWQNSARTTAITADGQVIGGVTDKSGVGNHLKQDTTAFKPLYKTGIQNLLSVGRVDTVDDRLINDGFISTYFSNQAAWTVLAMGVNKEAGNFPFLTHTLVGAVPRLYLSASAFSYNTNGTISGASQDPTINAYQHDNGTQEFWINASSQGTASEATQSFAPNNIAYIGGLGNVAGDIGEILVYNQAISNANLDLLFLSLNNKWSAY